MRLFSGRNRLAQKLWTELLSFCNLDRQDPEAQKEVVGMRLPVYYTPAMKSIEISLPWHSSTIPIADRNHDIIRGRLIKPLNPQHAAKPWSPKDFFGGHVYSTHNTQGHLAKLESWWYHTKIRLFYSSTVVVL